MIERGGRVAKLLGWVIGLSLLVPLVSGAQAHSDELVIYTYDSLVAPGGFGAAIFPLFEKKCRCKVRALASGDGGQILSRLQIDAERGKPTAQLVLGFDEATFARAKPYLDVDWKPRGTFAPEVGTPPDGFLPYDYGFYSFIFDRESKLTPPAKLADLLKPEWRRRFILEDPRISMPGTAFVLFTDQVLGPEWSAMRTHWLTLTQGWDQAYGLFLKGEAPLVWSYTTSQAYHESEGVHRYQAVLFEEGQPIVVEGAALVKGSDHRLAREFLEFLISPEAQGKVAHTNWMFPARAGVELPPEFKALPHPRKVIRLDSEPARVKAALEEWRRKIRE